MGNIRITDSDLEQKKPPYSGADPKKLSVSAYILQLLSAKKMIL